MKTKRLMILAIVLAAVLILPVGAKACLISVTVQVTAGNQAFDQTFTGDAVATADGRFECVLVGQDVATFDEGAITYLKVFKNADPEVGVEFGVRAGGSAATISILSDVVSFGPLVNPMAYASAGVTLTNIAPAGATITGLFGDGQTHQARYNGTRVFANLVDTFVVPSTGTVVNEEEYGNESSMITINDTLTSIESEFRFRLSARDSASGSSTFVVTPEPATVCLFGLGALSLLRKRKTV